jgi:cathepsin L
MFLVSMATNSSTGGAFFEFQQTFNKTYATSEDLVRARNSFVANLAFISRHNEEAARGLHTYEVGINSFADLTSDEFASAYLNPQFAHRVDFEEVWLPPVDSNSSVDWRNVSGKAYVTHVKDQKKCGSCWAFSAVGSTESAWALAGHTLVSLSEQQLVSCDKKDHGCKGGVMDDAFKYIHAHGLTAEENFKYTAKNGKCNQTKAHNVSAAITGFKNVPDNS